MILKTCYAHVKEVKFKLYFDGSLFKFKKVLAESSKIKESKMQEKWLKIGYQNVLIFKNCYAQVKEEWEWKPVLYSSDYSNDLKK